MNRGPPPLAAVQRKPALMCFDHATNECQAHPRAGRFGGEEFLARALAGPHVHARASVLDGDHQLTLHWIARRSDPEGTSLGHGLEGVPHQIFERFREESGVPGARGQIGTGSTRPRR